MNLKSAQKTLFKFAGNRYDPRAIEDEKEIARIRIGDYIQRHPKLKQFRELPITDDLLHAFVYEFYNSAGWDHRGLRKILEEHPEGSFMTLREEVTARLITQLASEGKWLELVKLFGSDLSQVIENLKSGLEGYHNALQVNDEITNTKR